MKIKIFIVTYNNDLALSACLKSLSKSYIPDNVSLDCFIINNYDSIKIELEYPAKIMNNVLRPNFSTGHLARNWNQAIINGFENLNNPACDILVTCQVDTIFQQDWISKIIEHHKLYCLITMCPGDGFVSYTADAIKRIGLWDERFCTIEFQEADYFLRSLIFNKSWSSINDFHHGRVLNPILTSEKDDSLVYRKNTNFEIHSKSTNWTNYLLNFYKSKYSKNPMMSWDDDFIKNPPQLKKKLIMQYPYFEIDVLNFKELYDFYKDE